MPKPEQVKIEKVMGAHEVIMTGHDSKGALSKEDLQKLAESTKRKAEAGVQHNDNIKSGLEKDQEPRSGPQNR